MTHRLDVARGRDIVGRWCSLAEQRLDHLTELFESGRWRRYHSESAFLENIQEAKAAVELWRDLLTREAARDQSAIDISWLGRPRPALPRGEMLPGQALRFQFQPAPKPAASPSPVVSINLETVQMLPEQAPSTPAPDADIVPELTLDVTAMQDRYPLLRNAL
jgi:uncharacterized repeat protein (TIGR03809 family)